MCVGGVRVDRPIYVYMVGVVGCVRRVGLYWKEGEKRNYII